MSMFQSYRQIEEKELVERIQRQVQEEGNRLEHKFSSQVSASEEMTHKIYHHLTRKLQLEKERLGY